ncbi:MAG: glycosyltransferase family 2 protein [Lachnospiraceae bacterium]
MISVIIPMYNSEKFIKRAIKSVQSQLIQDIEIIIINDGSTDHSQKIVEQLAKEDVRIKLFNQKNGGASKARNVGLSKATGDYVVFVDSDDQVEPDIYEILLNNLIENNANFSIVAPKIIDPFSKYNHGFGTGEKFIFETKDALKNYLTRTKFSMHLGDKLFPKKIYTQIRFIEERSINEDRFFIFEAMLKSDKIVFEDVEKYIYEKREGSLASYGKFKVSKLDTILFARDMLELGKDIGLDDYLYTNYCMTVLEAYRNIIRDRQARKEFILKKYELKKDIKNMNVQNLKISKLKKLELDIVKYISGVYPLFVVFFDRMFR